jgi:hypothetical protein
LVAASGVFWGGVSKKASGHKDTETRRSKAREKKVVIVFPGPRPGGPAVMEKVFLLLFVHKKKALSYPLVSPV